MEKTLLIICIGLAACGPRVPDMGKVARDVPIKDSGLKPDVAPDRFTVTRQMTFVDELAYGSARAVYVLRDNETGREWVGISGIGISELGDHQAGKSRTRDER